MYMLTLHGGQRDGLQDQLQLVKSRCARKQRLPPKHLSQYAAQAPHVHPRGVPGAGRGVCKGREQRQMGAQGKGSEYSGGPCRTRMQGTLWDLKGQGRLGLQLLPSAGEKNLWSAVPACGYILRQGLALRSLREVTQGACQAKVTEFHPASGIQ